MLANPEPKELQNPIELDSGAKIGWYHTDPYGLIKVGAEGMDVPSSLAESLFTDPAKVDMAIEQYINKRRAMLEGDKGKTKGKTKA